jgi:hypothetical protein
LFNLLVSARGWADARDRLLESRAFEYTDQHLIDRFKPGGKFDFSALISHPALFLEEMSGRGGQVARVGTITRVRISGRDLVVEYVHDPLLPPLTNDRIKEFADELDIEDFEFYRTHWSIKDVDLFRVLLRNMQPRRQLPKVFSIADPENIEPISCYPFEGGLS